MKKPYWAFFIFLTVVLPHSAAQEACQKDISFVKEIFNFHVISPGIMRGSQPSESDLRLLRDCAGVKTVLSLRNDEQAVAWEKVVVERLGMKFVNIPMSGRAYQNELTIEGCLAIMHEQSCQPLFVHCRAGKDRTGMIAAAYRIKYHGWSIEQAVKEMVLYGFDRINCSALEESLLKWYGRRKKN